MRHSKVSEAINKALSKWDSDLIEMPPNFDLWQGVYQLEFIDDMLEAMDEDFREEYLDDLLHGIDRSPKNKHLRSDINERLIKDIGDESMIEEAVRRMKHEVAYSQAMGL